MTRTKIKVGYKIPHIEEFALINGKIETTCLQDFKGKLILLFFYPLDFNSMSLALVDRFSAKMHQFAQLNVQLIGCSTDSHLSHLYWQDIVSRAIEFPLLADKSMKVSKMFGVLDDETGCPMNSFCIIDDQQILRHIVTSDLSHNFNEILRMIETMQPRYSNLDDDGWFMGKIFFYFFL